MALRQSNEPTALVRLTVQITRAQMAWLQELAREQQISLALSTRQVFRTAMSAEQPPERRAS